MIFLAAGLLKTVFYKAFKCVSPAEDSDTLTCANSLAGCYIALEKPQLALPLLKRNLKILQSKAASDDDGILSCKCNMGTCYKEMGQRDLAVPLLEEALRLTEKKYGPGNLKTVSVMGNLAACYGTAMIDRAIPMMEKTLVIQEKKLGDDHPDTLFTMNNLARSYSFIDKPDRALPLFEKARIIAKNKLGDHNNFTISIISNLAGCYQQLNRFEDSIILFSIVKKDCEEKNAQRTDFYFQTIANLGIGYRETERLSESIKFLEEAYRSSKSIAGLRWIDQDLFISYSQAGKRQEAIALCAEIVADGRSRYPKASPQFASVLAEWGLSLIKIGAYVEGRTAFSGMSCHSREIPAGRVEHLQCPVDARRRAARAEEIRCR